MNLQLLSATRANYVRSPYQGIGIYMSVTVEPYIGTLYRIPYSRYYFIFGISGPMVYFELTN